MDKKALSLLLTLAMVLGMAPMAYAEGAANVAEVTIGGVTTGYSNIKAAFTAANNAAGDVTVKLLNNVELREDLQIGSGSTVRTITVDLNGKTIDGGTVAQVYTAGEHHVVFTGNGMITNSKVVSSSEDAPLNVYNGSQVVLDGVTINGLVGYGVYTCGTLDIKNATINAVDCKR